MATPVEVPKLGNTVEECVIAKWLKRPGDVVAAGDILAEVETDKAAFEISAPIGGTLLETFYEEGALAPVFSNLLVIGDPGEDAEPFRPRSTGTAAASQPDRQDVPAPAAAAPVSSPAESPDARLVRGALSPRARRYAAQRSFDPGAIQGSGPGGRLLEADVREAYFSSPRLSFAARGRVADGQEIRAEGSGPGGMVLSRDLGPAAARLSGIRQTIARRMRESLAATAQYTLHASADARGLLALRARIKQSDGVPDININDLVVFCTVKALLYVPELNVEFKDGKIHEHTEVHMGFACDTPRGLVTPVVRDAHLLTAGELAVRMKELAERAVKGTASVDDFSGATFTVSNLGGLGIESFTPLLNPPQVAILGVCAIQLKPVRQGEAIEFIDTIGLSLTLDHQVIDGAPGARFLKVLREKIGDVGKLCTI